MKKTGIKIEGAEEEVKTDTSEKAGGEAGEDTVPEASEEAGGKMEAEEEATEEISEENGPGQDGSDENDGAGEQAQEKAEENTPDPRDQKIAGMEDRHRRLMAEFDNCRKRSEKEKNDMFSTGARSVIEKILPVVDNFERALDASGKTGEKNPFMDGMEMVYKQLITELESIEVKPVEALGKPFDPALHNAVMQEDSEEQESGTVLKELQKGYTYKGQVVRHSMVSVVK